MLRLRVLVMASISLAIIGLLINCQASNLLAQPPSSTLTPVAWLPIVQSDNSSQETPIPDIPVLEAFENSIASWNVMTDVSGSNAFVNRSNQQAFSSSFAAQAFTSNQSDTAQVRVNFSDPATNHTWKEREGTTYWQRAYVYLPSTTVAQLGPNEYFTIAGLWPSASSEHGWFVRVRQSGELFVFGYTADGDPVEFKIYGTFPQDQWTHLEIGLHSQQGPGIKRSFAFLINGDFYGWYRQGYMTNETYNRAAIGIVNTNSNDDLSLFIDQWYTATNENFPTGVDNRSLANLQEKNYQNQNGTQWQIDWSTWEWNLNLDSQEGLYSANNRLQSGFNMDRMPTLNSGWAEIEIGWPNGTPNLNPNSYFGPMVGFRKDVAREENLEIIPIGAGNGQVNLTLEAWVNDNGDGKPVILAEWPMPVASLGGTHIPEAGDIIRARWEQLNNTQLNVRGSYFDASTNTWHSNVINITTNITNIKGINYMDGYHTASSITTDSSQYSIRRFKAGTIDTYP